METFVMMPSNYESLKETDRVSWELADTLAEAKGQGPGSRVFQMVSPWCSLTFFSTTHRETFLSLGALDLGTLELLTAWLDQVVFSPTAEGNRTTVAMITPRDDEHERGSGNAIQIIREEQDIDDGATMVTYHFNPAG